MQFNAHCEIVDGEECWWADTDQPGVYVAADSWDELWTLARELAFDEFEAPFVSLISPFTYPEAVAS